MPALLNNYKHMSLRPLVNHTLIIIALYNVSEWGIDGEETSCHVKIIVVCSSPGFPTMTSLYGWLFWYYACCLSVCCKLPKLATQTTWKKD